MSDTASRPSRGRKLALLALLLALVGAAGAGLAYRRALQPEPLEFEPFAFAPLEEPALAAKFALLGDLKSLIMGSKLAEVSLTQRQFNGLLFGHAEQTGERKARVLVEGDQLRVQSSRKLDNGRWANVDVAVKLELTPDSSRVEIQEGQLGTLPIVGPLRSWLSWRLSAEFQAERARNPRLERLKTLWVEEGQVHLGYTPPE